MGLFLFKRLITLIATLVGTSVVVFLVLEILPGNAAQILMGPDASPEAVQALAAGREISAAPLTVAVLDGGGIPREARTHRHAAREGRTDRANGGSAERGRGRRRP